MKYHRISNVDLSVCTAEQKIAYNLAFNAYINFEHEYKKLTVGINKAEAITKMISFEIRSYKEYCMTKYGKIKYDIDAIFCCLNAGLQEYIEHSFIASNYTEIGKAFPAHYLKLNN